MAAINMGLLDLAQIKSAATNSSYTSVRHSPGRWRSMLVKRIVYKMSGFNVSLGEREIWESQSSASTPPSGASLSDVIIDAVLVSDIPSGD